MSDAVFQVRELAVSYGAARVIENVNVDVAAGEIVGVVGPNGAGKTTTLRAISGLVARRRGSVMLNGVTLAERPEAVARAGIAHVPEGRGLIPSLTVHQNLRLAAIGAGRRLSDEDVRYATTVFPAIERLMDRRAGFLSGGEQQMVAISRGLVARPTILMVDELSLGLAPRIVKDMSRALRRVAGERRIGIFLVDQNVRGLSHVCDRIYVLQDGVSSVANKEDTELMRAVYFGRSG
ncbi:ABC transporter ATP-binding protein [Ramlibacter sp.]|uniref:ABC transporter ATP-binding protein n=1 Tax=Ramlibacter sp. TaxID=1917967 RepID=UPI003D0CC392